MGKKDKVCARVEELILSSVKDEYRGALRFDVRRSKSRVTVIVPNQQLGPGIVVSRLDVKGSFPKVVDTVRQNLRSQDIAAS